MQLTPAQLDILRNGHQPEAGQILKAWRQDKKLEQIDIARRLDTTYSTISTWETGKRWPDTHRRALLVAMVTPGPESNKIELSSHLTFSELEELVARARAQGKDSLVRTAEVLDAASDQVALTLAVAATGGLDYAGQVSKAIELFYKVRADVHAELRLRQAEGSIVTSKRGMDWLTGKESAIIKRERKVECSVTQSETTISSEEASLHNAPTATLEKETTTSSAEP